MTSQLFLLSRAHDGTLSRVDRTCFCRRKNRLFVPSWEKRRVEIIMEGCCLRMPLSSVLSHLVGLLPLLQYETQYRKGVLPRKIRRH